MRYLLYIWQERLKQAFSARDREMKQKKRLDNMKDKKPSDRHTIVSLLISIYFLCLLLDKTIKKNEFESIMFGDVHLCVSASHALSSRVYF